MVDGSATQGLYRKPNGALSNVDIYREASVADGYKEPNSLPEGVPVIQAPEEACEYTILLNGTLAKGHPSLYQYLLPSNEVNTTISKRDA